MSTYSIFAQYYDNLTQNIDYKLLADYYIEHLKKQGNNGRLVVDLACGTASLSFELAERGFDVISIDSSEEMLAEAMSKSQSISNPMFLCQKMQDLDLYGTIDAVFCSLDSINHLSEAQDVLKTFKKVSLFLNPYGHFIFDVNTLYKHQKVLCDNTFVYDTDEVYCVWQNELDKTDNSVNISLDFFKNEGKRYKRFSENFKEYYYSPEFINKVLQDAGFKIMGIYDDFTFNNIKEDSQRVTYVAQKVK